MTWRERDHPRDRRGRFAEKGEWVAALDAHLAGKLTRPHPQSALQEAREPARGEDAYRLMRLRDITQVQRRRVKPDRRRQETRTATMRRSLEMAIEQREEASLEDGIADMRRRGIPEHSPAWDRELGEITALIAKLDARVRAAQTVLERAEANPVTRGSYFSVGLDADISDYGPLAVYGDMLHFDDSAYSAGVLEALGTIDARFHRVVAEHMARQPDGGIYIGATRLTELDDLGRRLTGSPGGDWEGTKSWNAVNGVYHYGSRVLGVSLSPNALHRGMGRATAVHELGHALDDALTKISQAQEWYDIHKQVLKDSDRLSPHFKRDDAAGRSELWAESFFLWHAWQGDRDGFDRAYSTAFGLDLFSPAVTQAWGHFQRVSERVGT